MSKLVNIIDSESMTALAAEYGGIEYKVPTNIASQRGLELVTLIGAQAAQQLIDYAGGTEFYISRDNDKTLQARYQEIRAMHQRGYTPQEIAKGYTYQARYTERQIRSILAGGIERVAARIYQNDSFGDDYGLT